MRKSSKVGWTLDLSARLFIIYGMIYGPPVVVAISTIYTAAALLLGIYNWISAVTGHFDDSLKSYYRERREYQILTNCGRALSVILIVVAIITTYWGFVICWTLLESARLHLDQRTNVL